MSEVALHLKREDSGKFLEREDSGYYLKREEVLSDADVRVVAFQHRLCLFYLRGGYRV